MNFSRRQSVFVLDSGIGGMTVVKAIRELDPELAVTYLSDGAFFPYGAIETDILIERVRLLVGQALDRFHFDAVVIACNTASTVVLDSLRAVFSVPIVGVVPPVKTAAELSCSRVIGLLATEGTVKSAYLDDLINHFAADCRVIRVGCPGLAELAEDKFFGKPAARNRLQSVMAPLRAADLSAADVIILGCTHFPIVKADLQKEIGVHIQLWLDPAFPVAQQLQRVIGENVCGDQSARSVPQRDVVYLTKQILAEKRIAPAFKKLGFSDLALWPDRYHLT